MSIKIGITIGDPAGIGPEIIDKALKSDKIPDAEYVVYGHALGVQAGAPSLDSAKIALDALEEGAKALKTGNIAALVTAPICKKNLQQVGFNFPGQTEFIAQRLSSNSQPYSVAMCMTGKHLTVGLVTIHEALVKVPTLLNQKQIERTGGLLTEFCLKKGILNPRIAVLGLNPHAGEQGLFGNEEQTVITPAIVNLSKIFPQAIISGPHSADTLFHQAYHGDYDAVLCMYHDQGLIPFKLVDFEEGVNVTLGLPHPRTSPDHGTAFDIAGKNIANPSSMIAAIKLAYQLG